MATTEGTTTAIEKDTGDSTGSAVNGSHPTHRYDYGGNPMAHAHTGDSARLPAFGGEFQPGLWKLQPADHRKLANPAPMGLCAFALTTFVLSCVNTNARGITAQNIAVPLAFGYGGVVQLLAGMWEMATGNTFGATAFASYGGFWISYGLLLTPSLAILGNYEGSDISSVLGFFLTGWFIFTTVLLLCTLRSSVAFFMLFFTLDLAFLLLACGNYATANGAANSATMLTHGGGYFGFFAAFLAWYNALAGIADTSNSFFIIPVFHFPWSEKGRAAREGKTEGQVA